MASYQKISLPSGVRALTVSLPDSETMTVLVLVNTGSRYETKELNGISHFLEHMLFKGTEKRPDKKEIAGVLDGVGASYNAFTGKEYTGYYVKVAKMHADLALDMVSDIYLRSMLPAREIEKERRVILEELKMNEDTPMAKVEELFEQVIFGDQPAGWPIGGTKESLQNITHEALKEYYKNHYTAGRTLVCIAGPWDHAQSVEKIREYFGATQNEGISLPNVQFIEQEKGPLQLIYNKKTDQTHLVLGFKAYDINHPDRYALDLLSAAFGGMMSSRLFLKVREQEGLAYYVHSDVGRYIDSGYLSIRAGVDNEGIRRALIAITEEIVLLKQKGLEEAELQKAKNHVRGQTALALESSSDWASFYGAQEILTNTTFNPDELLRKLDKVTLQDIARVINDVFQEEKLYLAMVGPVGKRDQEHFAKLLKF